MRHKNNNFSNGFFEKKKHAKNGLQAYSGSDGNTKLNASGYIPLKQGECRVCGGIEKEIPLPKRMGKKN